MTSEEGARSRAESRGRITDARGRKVTQLDPVTLHLLHRHDQIDAEALRAIAADVGPGVSRWQKGFFWTCFVLGASALVISLLRAFVYGRGLDAVGRALWITNAFCLCLGVYALWRRARRARFVRVQRIMLRHRRCPHCGYELIGLSPDAADSATVCPECGCAWRIDAGGPAAPEPVR